MTSAVFSNVKKYILIAKKLPGTVIVKTVNEVCSDELIVVKIAFFSSVASILEPFLRIFQTNALMGPFLYAEIFILFIKFDDAFYQKKMLWQKLKL